MSADYVGRLLRMQPAGTGHAGSPNGRAAEPLASVVLVGSKVPRRSGRQLLAFRVAIVCCVIGHLALSLLWATLVPPFEAHDETGHFAHVQWIATHLTIPEPGGKLTVWFDEAHQPPLYYWVAGVAGHVLGLGGTMHPAMNPFFLRGDLQGGANAVVHDAIPAVAGAQAVWLDHRWSRLLWLARAVSALFGAAAVWFTALLALQLAPGRPWLAVLAAAIAAGTPTFVFLSGAANNDAAIAATGGLALLLCVRWMVSDRTSRSRSARAALLAGGGIGLAMMTKDSGLELLGALAVVPAMRWRLGRARWPTAMRDAAIALLAVLLVSGWWYLRNLLRYGHPIMDRNEQSSITVNAGLPSGAVQQATTGHFLSALLQNSFDSYWALFGWGNVGPSSGVLALFLILAIVALAGWLRWALLTVGSRDSEYRRAVGIRGDVALLLAVLFALIVALPLYRAIHFIAPALVPGRYLFIGMAASSSAVAVGLWAITAGMPSTIAVIGRAVAGLFPGVMALLLLFTTVLPAYALPTLRHGPLPVDATPLSVQYGGRIALVGYRVVDPAVQPGHDLAVKLYWKALARMQTSYTITVQLVDAARRVVGRTDRLPGHGNFPTTLWQPGDEFGETYLVQLNPATPQTPQLGHIVVNVSDYAPSRPGGNDFATRRVLRTFDAQQHPLSQVVFADLRFGAPPVIGALRPARDVFDGHFDLVALALPSGPTRPGGRLPITLAMQLRVPDNRRAVFFAHVLSAQGKVIAQEDTQPQVAGRPYPTSLWTSGELVRVTLAPRLPVRLAAGDYRVEVGMYWQVGTRRLPVVDARGVRQAQDRLLVGPITVR